MDVAIGLEPLPLKRHILPELQYSIVPENLYQLELGEYYTYGIQVTTPECTQVLHDVSVCKKTTEDILKCLNHYQVSPIHLYDVVTDILT